MILNCIDLRKLLGIHEMTSQLLQGIEGYNPYFVFFKKII